MSSGLYLQIWSRDKEQTINFKNFFFVFHTFCQAALQNKAFSAGHI